MNYEEYLHLDQLLTAQKPLSVSSNRPAHDEWLFITVHHTYELWFKQILLELNSTLETLSRTRVEEREMDTVVARLERVNLIFHVIAGQFDILETMTPMDFLEFRDLIFSASGFQSYQFRLLENKLGLRPDDRLPYHEKPYYIEISAAQSKTVRQSETQPSLFDCLDAWLARTPFLDTKEFAFWEEYRRAVDTMFEQDESFVRSNKTLNDAEKARLYANIQGQRQMFADLFNEDAYEKQRARGEWRLSYRAIHAAFLIQLYRDQPIFHLPFRLITEVLNLDSHFTQWRYRHALMVKRMLGNRMGSGGSTGEKYLRESTEKHKIFEDFYKLTTFFIPRSRLPKLPEAFAQKLDFALNR